MAEYIEREALIKTTRETPFTMSMCLTVEECKGMNRARNILAEIFEIVPSADVAPVVRCKDCQHRDPEDHKCDSGGFERQGCPFKVSDDYFCAYGER